jgi:hypothetical protein
MPLPESYAIFILDQVQCACADRNARRSTPLRPRPPFESDVAVSRNLKLAFAQPFPCMENPAGALFHCRRQSCAMLSHG